MAHVERRADRKYRARYRGPDGRERSRTFDTKRDAERWLAKVETKKAAGEWVDPAAGKVRFDDYAAAWLATKVDVAPRTLVNIEGRVRHHASPYFGPMAMAEVRVLHVRAWVANMHAAGLARPTVKAAYLTVAQVFSAAVIDGVIGRTPCVGIDFGTERAREEALFLTASQVGDLADAITPRYRCAVLVAGYEGLRAGELWALKARSVSELTRTIDVTESAYEVGGVRAEGPTKTGKVRTVGLPSFLAEEIKTHLGEYGTSNEGHLFSSATGTPVRHHNFALRHFKPAVCVAGLPQGLRWHDLRHTCAALLIEAGRHLEEVRDHLGHSTIRVTSDTYGHLFPRARQAVADALDEAHANRNADNSRPARGLGA